MPRWLGPIRAALAGGSVAWAALLPLAPLAASRPDPSVWTWSFSVVMYGVGSIVCHQLPDRSFHLWSRQFPVCARCTGIYVGAAIAALVAASRRRGERVAGVEAARLALLITAMPTVATLAIEWTTSIAPGNWVRALAGLPLGAAAAWLVIRVN